ncbi:MAG: hypothetical protein HQL46_16510 [Gammaproteobacteria bacterium]|nr:hypothetical protein [Gammaproteobacteria bacterium]
MNNRIEYLDNEKHIFLDDEFVGYLDDETPMNWSSEVTITNDTVDDLFWDDSQYNYEQHELRF